MSSSPTLDQLSRRGLEIAGMYDDLNLAQRGRVWTRAETMMGFVGDVGDLAKLVMAAEGARSDVDETRAALEHELADCLWAVLVLAHRYDVDLAAAYEDAMDGMEQRLKG
jgi:NTP pyrophosphatase (non-canonical NTP hydrolase)